MNLNLLEVKLLLWEMRVGFCLIDLHKLLAKRFQWVKHQSCERFYEKVGNSAFCLLRFMMRICTLSPLKSFMKGTCLTLFLTYFYLKVLEHGALLNVL